MTKEEFIQFCRTSQDLIDTTDANDEKTKWLTKMAFEAQKTLMKLNTTYHSASEIVALFSELTASEVDDSFRCFPPFFTDFGKNIKIGKNVFINTNCSFQDRGKITIGDQVLIGMNVTIATLNHGLAPDKRAIITPQPVIIENNVWIGSHATILGGVTIGQNSIIAAGAVVTKNVEPNAIYAGVPAKKIKSLNEKN